MSRTPGFRFAKIAANAAKQFRHTAQEGVSNNHGCIKLYRRGIGSYTAVMPVIRGGHHTQANNLVCNTFIETLSDIFIETLSEDARPHSYK